MKDMRRYIPSLMGRAHLGETRLRGQGIDYRDSRPGKRPIVWGDLRPKYRVRVHDYFRGRGSMYHMTYLFSSTYRVHTDIENRIS